MVKDFGCFLMFKKFNIYFFYFVTATSELGLYFYFYLLTITIKSFPPIRIFKSFKQLNRLGKNNGRGEEGGLGGFIQKRGLLNITFTTQVKHT